MARPLLTPRTTSSCIMRVVGLVLNENRSWAVFAMNTNRAVLFPPYLPIDVHDTADKENPQQASPGSHLEKYHRPPSHSRTIS